MIIDVTNEIFTQLKTTLTDVNCRTSYPSGQVVFPILILEDGGNTTDISTITSGGETHNDCSIFIDVFCNSPTKMTDAKKIASRVDNIMSQYRVNRTMAQPIPNLVDTNVYRYRLAYTFKIDTNKRIYRR